MFEPWLADRCFSGMRQCQADNRLGQAGPGRQGTARGAAYDSAISALKRQHFRRCHCVASPELRLLKPCSARAPVTLSSISSSPLASRYSRMLILCASAARRSLWAAAAPARFRPRSQVRPARPPPLAAGITESVQHVEDAAEPSGRPPCRSSRRHLVRRPGPAVPRQPAPAAAAAAVMHHATPPAWSIWTW